MLADAPTTAERAVETGTRGSGGDRTLVIDDVGRDVVFAELERAPRRRAIAFIAISEERGEIDFGDSDVRVIIDPIDGSLNAKRGLAAPRPVDRGRRRPRRWPTSSSVTCTTSGRRGVVGATRRGRVPRRRAAGPGARRAARPRRPPRGARDRVRRSALGRGLDRRAGRARLPAAGARHDRAVALPGRGGPLRRDGVAARLRAASTPPPAS